MALLSDIVDALGEAFPWELAPPTDGSGLLAGSLACDVRAALCALDPSTEALEAAARTGCGLLLVHHPQLLRDSDTLRDWDSPGGRLARRAAEAGMNLVACHLNADAAPGGVADMMAGALGLEVEGPLTPAGDAWLATVVTFVPPEAAGAVAEAMGDAAAGVIGGYSRCSFAGRGTGEFLPGEGSDPAVGERGVLNRVEEVRLEMRVPSFAVHRVVSAMQSAHPYEQPAWEAYRSEAPVPWGVGRIGTLVAPVTVTTLAERLGRWCGSPSPMIHGDPAAVVRRPAVMPGMADLRVLPAIRAGCDAMVTGEVSLHGKREAEEAGMPLVALGHAESERPLVGRMARVLQAASAAANWDLEVSVFGPDQEGVLG